MQWRSSLCQWLNKCKNTPEMVLFWKKWANFQTKSHKYSKFDFVREIQCKSPIRVSGRSMLYSGESRIIGECWHTCIPRKLFYVEQDRPVLTMHLHGKTGISRWKSKWFMPIHFGSFKNDGLWFEVMYKSQYITSNHNDYFSVVKPHFRDTCVIWTPHYYRQFALSLGQGKKVLWYIFSKFNQFNMDTLLIRTPSTAVWTHTSVAVLTGFDCTSFSLFNWLDRLLCSGSFFHHLKFYSLILFLCSNFHPVGLCKW